MSKVKELREELKTVFAGKGGQILDSILPIIFFLILNRFFGWQTALWIALGFNIVLAIIRLFQRKKIVFALAGIGSIALATFFILLNDSASGYFVPGLISGMATILLCLFSVIFHRPLAAWSSFVTRRWTLNWYWHPRVLPAYSQVTLFWAFAFGIRLAIQYLLFRQDAVNALGFVNILLGWPYTIMVLVISYLYGIWRLRELGGPSVEEFNQGKTAPWEGQRRGF
ncbi:MAG: DUF3159 domain-containing protein [Anaerolineae bacterium]|nr:DUF3159 domain-containing protein [Anaerolineae bacterium]